LGGSLYTEALLEALDGGAAQPNLGWWIGTHGLQTALAAYVARLAATEKVEQHPDVGRMALFKVHQPAKEKIKVPLYVTSAPKEALRRARVEARLGQKISAYFDPKKHKPLDEWRVRLPIREHTLAAWFHAPAEYEDEPPQVVVIAPPEIPFEFQFRRKA